MGRGRFEGFLFTRFNIVLGYVSEISRGVLTSAFCILFCVRSRREERSSEVKVLNLNRQGNLVETIGSSFFEFLHVP